ncbi:DUF4407 domain-containing protein [Chitinophaga alhagiae]|uniref:DUF4407 domain-containing protein n=1 Tax=Chitinophaga alhagiae TaxID=2203219 RepID=A0ABM6W9I4_9BACT|nr:DUF4407 domain-containing protein [Chitinophaga alhagiae]AWO00594.1 DUF4407 domain-containing protein [Chitinophaga alhagiae]
MLRIRQFFLICSGAHLPMLRRAPVETNKYAGIGGTIFFTGLLAALSGGYALWTVFREPWAAILFGLVWGLMIFNLDRYIVSSMKKRERFGQELWMATPRIVLAVIIAIVISKPLELQIFDREIQAELVLMEQAKFKEQEDKVKERYQGRTQELTTRLQALQQQIDAQAARRDTLMLLAQQEADGTGGSRVKNLGPIYKAKKTDADSATAALTRLQHQYTGLQQELATQDSATAAAVTQLKRGSLDGLASRLDALGTLTQTSAPIRWANWFIMLLFIAIETAPVFVKLISPRGPYDDLLEQHEYAFIMHKKEKKAILSMETEERIAQRTARGGQPVGQVVV